MTLKAVYYLDGAALRSEAAISFSVCSRILARTGDETVTVLLRDTRRTSYRPPLDERWAVSIVAFLGMFISFPLVPLVGLGFLAIREVGNQGHAERR